jgi:hypothetical protein
LDETTDHKRFIVDIKNLPASFPTHRHSAAFWENLGRTVATFGFLEEVLGKAIFAFTATKTGQFSTGRPVPKTSFLQLKASCDLKTNEAKAMSFPASSTRG